MTTSATEVRYFDTETIQERIADVRELNEKIIAATKKAGQASLDAYENALQSFVDFDKKAVSKSPFEWVRAVTSTQATLVQAVTRSYIVAAREVLN
jgi:hypothetical protein